MLNIFYFFFIFRYIIPRQFDYLQNWNFLFNRFTGDSSRWLLTEHITFIEYAIKGVMIAFFYSLVVNQESTQLHFHFIDLLAAMLNNC